MKTPSLPVLSPMPVVAAAAPTHGRGERIDAGLDHRGVHLDRRH